MNTEPTEEQINRGIAEWMGWKVRPGAGYIECWILEDGDGVCRRISTLSGEKCWSGFNLFTIDHNACAEVLEKMTDAKFEHYLNSLMDIVDYWRPGTKSGGDRRLHRATALQKAEAIYRAITSTNNKHE